MAFLRSNLQQACVNATRNFSTTQNLDNKRVIMYILSRRKALRKKKMRYRYANDIAFKKATRNKWHDDRHAADLELVWRQNGLEEEPPIMTFEEKDKKLREWYESGQIQTIMSHEELSDYNISLPIRTNVNKTQPWIWRTLENPSIPRHQRSLFESLNYFNQQTQNEMAEKYGTEVSSQEKADPDFNIYNDVPLNMQENTKLGIEHFIEKGKEYEIERAMRMDQTGRPAQGPESVMPWNSFNMRGAAGKKRTAKILQMASPEDKVENSWVRAFETPRAASE